MGEGGNICPDRCWAGDMSELCRRSNVVGAMSIYANTYAFKKAENEKGKSLDFPRIIHRLSVFTPQASQSLLFLLLLSVLLLFSKVIIDISCKHISADADEWQNSFYSN